MHAIREKLRDERMIEAFRCALGAKNINEDSIAQVILDGLHANDVQVVAKDGVVKAKVEVPNWLAKHKSVENAQKALGLVAHEEQTEPAASFHLEHQ